MEWIEIKNDTDIQLLNETYDNFEDSYIVRMEYISGDYVDKEYCGHMVQTNDLKVVFQRLDSSPFSIELWFTNTKRLSFVFANPTDNCLSDILYAKVCANDKSLFWTVWEEFDPNNEEHISGTTLIESDGLKWRIIEN